MSLVEQLYNAKDIPEFQRIFKTQLDELQTIIQKMSNIQTQTHSEFLQKLQKMSNIQTHSEFLQKLQKLINIVISLATASLQLLNGGYSGYLKTVMIHYPQELLTHHIQKLSAIDQKLSAIDQFFGNILTRIQNDHVNQLTEKYYIQYIRYIRYIFTCYTELNAFCESLAQLSGVVRLRADELNAKKTTPLLPSLVFGCSGV